MYLVHVCRMFGIKVNNTEEPAAHRFSYYLYDNSFWAIIIGQFFGHWVSISQQLYFSRQHFGHQLSILRPFSANIRVFSFAQWLNDMAFTDTILIFLN